MKAIRRIVRIGVLVAVLGAIILTSVAIAQGEERARERSATDCDAVGRRLRAAVEVGELTPEEARARYGAVCGERTRERCAADCDALGRRLRAAVEAGELTPEEARARYDAACGRRERSEEDQETT